jgi:hypothetical protein
MKFFDWLFRARPPANRPTFAIPITKDDPAELHVLAEPRARFPRKRGRTPEQIAADLEAYQADLRRKFQASFDLNRKRAMSIGSTHYRWKTSRDDGVCAVCAKREGRRFAWNIEPPHGHAGVCDACPKGYCRCGAEPIFPKW